MHKDDSANMDYSDLNKREIKDIQEIEEKINRTRAKQVILLAVNKQ